MIHMVATSKTFPDMGDREDIAGQKTSGKKKKINKCHAAVTGGTAAGHYLRSIRKA